MSTLYVDTITEKTAGNGVQIPGHVVKVTRVQNTGINTTLATDTATNFFTFSLTATAGNIIYVSSVVPTRDSGTSGYSLSLMRILAGGSTVFNSGFTGDNNATTTQEPLTHIPISSSWVWTGSGSNTQTISVQGYTYNSVTKSFGATNQANETTTPVFNFMEIAQ
jgi:hypothetical protein